MKHETGDGQIDPGGADRGKLFIVSAQASKAAQPGESTLDDPAPGEEFETCVGMARDDVKMPAVGKGHQVGQVTGVALIGPDALQTGKLPGHGFKDRPRAVAIRDVGWMDDDL